MDERDKRIEFLYQESAWDLANWLVDAEDEIEVWKERVRKMGDEHEKTEDEEQSDSQRGYEHDPAEQQ